MGKPVSTENHQELVIEIIPPQTLCLIWETSSDRLSQKQQLLNRKIHEHYSKTPEHGC